MAQESLYTPAICVVGSLNMDLVAYAPHLPTAGETVLGGPFATYPGGKGANQAVAAARLGATVAMIGRVGDDGFGRELYANLIREGVASQHVIALSEVATGVALITVDAEGQNTIVVAPGANALLTVEDINAAAAAITSAQTLLLQLETPLDVVRHAAALAHDAGVTVILNPAPAQPLPVDILNLIDCIIPNEHEAAILLDQPDAADAKNLADMVRAHTGIATVVVTLGARGAALATTALSTMLPAHPVHAIDATAAGDAFVAAFAVALANGHSTEQAVRWGNAAGALATTKTGAQPSLPKHSELAAFLHD